MPKRFTSTEIWDEDWYLEMPNEYKLFWYYMLSKCDHAGLFRVNTKKFSLMIGANISSKEALKLFNADKDRIREVTTSLWLIEDFFVFQYGKVLNTNSKVHESIQKAYNQANINLTSIRGLSDLKDRVKDKDKEIKKGGTGENKGIEFVNGSKVKFADGSFQELGEKQKELIASGDFKPNNILKGSIY